MFFDLLKIMSQPSLLILGIVKNVQDSFTNTFEWMDPVLRLNSLSECWILENDSNDETIQIIQDCIGFQGVSTNRKHNNFQLKQFKTDQYTLLSTSLKQYLENTVTSKAYDGALNRIHVIKEVRNILLDIVHEQFDIANRFTHVVWIDMDGLHTTLNEFQNAIHRMHNADAIFCNSLSNNEPDGTYYDLYALWHETEFPHNRVFMGEKTYDEQCTAQEQSFPTFIRTQTKHVPVLSAFGGIGIYKSNLFTRDLRYKVEPFDDFENFVNENNLVLEAQSSSSANNASWPVQKFQDSNIYWHACSGYQEPVYCEHIGLHIQMHIQNPLLKIYIDPLFKAYRVISTFQIEENSENVAETKKSERSNHYHAILIVILVVIVFFIFFWLLKS